jgi:peptidoglycan-N-acetylglucosamine deacetylase
MNLLWIKTPRWVKRIFSNLIWEVPNTEKVVYLTFDDGPTPEITDWVLEELAKYHFKATFFLIGDNIRKYPETAQNILKEGHTIGNHTFNHWNGWQKNTDAYIANTELGAQQIKNTLGVSPVLFRPPYGKLKPSQVKALRQKGFKIIMWDIITYDWDSTKSPEFCLNTITKNVESGSIIVFHDSKKAFGNLKVVLPKALQYLNENGFRSESLT